MAHEGLVDKRAYLNTIGCLIQDSSLIDDIDSQQNSTTPESYIKALINNYYKQANANKDYAKDRINSYKLNNKEFSPF